MATRRLPGGILWLLDLVERARAELTYDLRRILGVSLYDLGFAITYREGIDLCGMLVRNPETWIHAVLNQWEYPVSHEWILAKHSFDLLATVNAEKRPPEYPAPWIASSRPTPQPRASVLEKLQKMNPERD